MPSPFPPSSPRRASPSFPCVVAARLAVAVLVPASLAVSAASAGTGLDGVGVRLAADDLAVVARGENVYRDHCASCHGANLEGQPDWRGRDAAGLLPAPPHDASGHTWHHADDLLFEIVKYGPGAVIGDTEYPSAMPVYGGTLSDEDIVAVLSYIKNSWPAEQRDWQEEVNGTFDELATPAVEGDVLERLFK